VDASVILQLVAGLALLIIGGEFLVRGASRLAAAAGLSPLVIGLTVVAFGTSAPEMAASVTAALQGRGDIAFGNVVGSNIFNVLFILGVSALVVPLAVSRKLVRSDVPIMIGVSALVFAMGYDGWIGRWDGIVLVGGLAAYVLYSMRVARGEPGGARETHPDRGARPSAGSGRIVVNVVLIGAGLAVLVLGSRWLVDGAVVVARALGVSELIIGLTIVAAGTSLPEVATSVLAAIRRETDIAVGNVVGSNIFNILGVLGLSGAVAPDGVSVSPIALRFDVPVMIATAVACAPIFFTDSRISRWEGALFFAYYAAYTAFLVLDATRHDALPALSWVLLGFAVPLTALALAAGTLQGLRARRGKGSREP